MIDAVIVSICECSSYASTLFKAEHNGHCAFSEWQFYVVCVQMATAASHAVESNMKYVMALQQYRRLESAQIIHNNNNSRYTHERMLMCEPEPCAHTHRTCQHNARSSCVVIKLSVKYYKANGLQFVRKLHFFLPSSRLGSRFLFLASSAAHSVTSIDIVTNSLSFLFHG